jgi:hypothetical protein
MAHRITDIIHFYLPPHISEYLDKNLVFFSITYFGFSWAHQKALVISYNVAEVASCNKNNRKSLLVPL